MKVSIITSVYNNKKTIKDAIKSVVNQTYDDIEYIIVDGGSSDGTIDIVKSYGDKISKLISEKDKGIYENQKFKSPIFNFENALKNSNGDYIFLADQDDIWMPNKVEVLKEFLANYNLVLSDANIIDSENMIKNNSKNGLLKNIVKNSYLGCTMAFNRKILRIALPFPRDIPIHDWWIGLIGEIYGKTYFIEDKLISYRRHDNNASPTGEKSTYSLTEKIIFRLRMIKNLFWRYFR